MRLKIYTKERKNVIEMKKESKLSYIIIVILIILIIVMGIYIIFTLFRNKTDDEKLELSNTIQYSVDIQKDLVKSEIYVTDLNHDNIKERVTINYYGENNKLNKIDISLEEENNKILYEILDIDLEIKFDIKSEIVDIDKKDNYSEIMLTGKAFENSKYISAIFLTYNRKKLSSIKINYDEKNVKTYNYNLNKDKNIHYLRMGESITKEIQKDNKIYEQLISFEIDNNSIIVVSNSGKQEVYEMNSKHELELTSSKLIKDTEFYKNYISTSQKTIKVYQENNLNSQSYGAQETLNLEVVEVMGNWLKLKLPTDVIVYSYSDDILD